MKNNLIASVVKNEVRKHIKEVMSLEPTLDKLSLDVAQFHIGSAVASAIAAVLDDEQLKETISSNAIAALKTSPSALPKATSVVAIAAVHPALRKAVTDVCERVITGLSVPVVR